MIINRGQVIICGIALLLCSAWSVHLGRAGARQTASFAAVVQQIIRRPEFRHATFGIEFYSLDRDQPIFQMNPQELFTPASTTKLLTEGTALELLGPDYRFHTRVYRTGPIDTDGTLHGDLVLVASGDLNLSQRVQPNGTLAFENEDHCYGGSFDTRAVPGDPLIVIRQLAQQVAAHGVQQIDGRVLVDTSLFPEGARELGTGMVISPIIVNDNIVDVTVTPGASLGAPVTLSISPVTSYVHFTNQATTGPPDSDPDIEWSQDVTNPDGTHQVIVTGSVPLGKPSVLFAYAVPQPSRFAELALVEELRQQGITVSGAGGGPRPDFKALAANYTPQNLVAEHVSPPLSEDVKVTLKVSQNLHASVMPFILGAVLSHAKQNIDQAGFDLERGLLEKAGLDLSGASQSDGAGGSEAAFFTPDFMVHYLAFMYHQKTFPQFFAGLPVLGRDGTLYDVQTQSPAAGHVFAKTGTYFAYDALNRNNMVTGKGLAGYMTMPDGRHLAFAIYANRVAVPNTDESITKIVGQALGEVAAAAYMAPPGALAARGDSTPRSGRIQNQTSDFRFQESSFTNTRYGSSTEKSLLHEENFSSAEASFPAQSGGSRATSSPRDLASATAQADAPDKQDAAQASTYDVLIENGHILDGTGNPWYEGDVAIQGDRIAAMGNLRGAKARRIIDATNLVVAPGFIDMLGQSEWALLIDPRSLSKLSQGITTEITGEGGSIAPQDSLTLAPLEPFLQHYHLKVDWATLDEYFQRLERQGTPLNIGTYVGAAQVREAVLGDVDRAPTANELRRMQNLVARAMQQGALGLSTALVYPPGSYAKTDELVALAKIAAQYGGIYATHMRSEGATEMAALREAFRIGREAHIPVEIFHLKVSGKSRWGSMPKVVGMIDTARRSGLDVTADMYPYLAGVASLSSCLPTWVANGGPNQMLARLRDPAIRKRIKTDMLTEQPDSENFYLDSGGPSGIVVSCVMNPALKKYEGQTIQQIAQSEGKPPLDALFDLVLADNAQTEALYFLAGEPDLEYGLKQPWTSIGLDAQETNLDGPLYEPHDHPRAWGSMPRFLGYYVREKRLLRLEDAIRKITSLPANREHLAGRGLLKPGFYADITVFNPAEIKNTATYLHPASLSEGIEYVLVNGQFEFEHGHLTGIKAGKPLRGPGWREAEGGKAVGGR
jgi:N-acyl-D-amino-acid deacylase